MRIFTLVLLFVGLNFKAQNYSYFITDYRNNVPAPMLGVPGDQFKSTITFTNSSSSTFYIHIKRTQKSIPLYWAQWYYYVQHCIPSQDTITVKLMPNSSSPLTLHFKTDSVKPGIATASFKMYQTGLEDDAETFNLTASTKGTNVGIVTGAKLRDFQIFPNPTNRLLYITATETKKTTITICDALGFEKYKAEKIILPQEVDLSEYAAGVYFVKVSDGETTYFEKIIKN